MTMIQTLNACFSVSEQILYRGIAMRDAGPTVETVSLSFGFGGWLKRRDIHSNLRPSRFVSLVVDTCDPLGATNRGCRMRGALTRYGDVLFAGMT